MSMSNAPPSASPRRQLWDVVTALLLWSLCFSLLYAGLSLGCESGWHTVPLFGSNALTLTLAATWMLHLLLIGGWMAHLWRGREHPARHIALSCAAIAWFATLWIGWPVIALPPCAGPEATGFMP